MKEKIKKIKNIKNKKEESCCCNSKSSTGGLIILSIGIIALFHQIIPSFAWNIGPIILIIIGIRILTRCKK